MCVSFADVNTFKMIVFQMAEILKLYDAGCFDKVQDYRVDRRLVEVFVLYGREVLLTQTGVPVHAVIRENRCACCVSVPVSIFRGLDWHADSKL